MHPQTHTTNTTKHQLTCKYTHYHTQPAHTLNTNAPASTHTQHQNKLHVRTHDRLFAVFDSFLCLFLSLSLALALAPARSRALSNSLALALLQHFSRACSLSHTRTCAHTLSLSRLLSLSLTECAVFDWFLQLRGGAITPGALTQHTPPTTTHTPIRPRTSFACCRAHIHTYVLTCIYIY